LREKVGSNQEKGKSGAWNERARHSLWKGGESKKGEGGTWESGGEALDPSRFKRVPGSEKRGLRQRKRRRAVTFLIRRGGEGKYDERVWRVRRKKDERLLTWEGGG